MTELGLTDARKLILYCDNQSAIKLAYNPVQHGRTKHIDLRYHYVREKIEDGTVIVKYLSTERMPADMFTKPLGRIVFERQLEMNGIISRSRFRGGVAVVAFTLGGQESRLFGSGVGKPPAYINSRRSVGR
jgi:hypothetical protein